MDAKHASRNVISSTLTPLFFSVEKRKNSPVLNAMNAKAMSAMKSILSIRPIGIRFKQYGPIKMPATM